MERLREAGRPRTGWMGWTVGRGSAGRPDLQAGPDRLAQSGWQDRMAKMGKADLPAHGDFPERQAPKGWPGLPALTVRTEMRVKLAHRGLAVFRVRLVRQGPTAARESPGQTDLMGRTAGRSPLR